MRRGFWIRNGLVHDPAAVVAHAVAAEEGGWDGVFVSDAVAESHTEPFTHLAAVAGATHRVVLGTWVTPLVCRDVLTVARQAAVVDRLSAGRLLLGIGLGNPVEHAATGVVETGRVLAERHETALRLLDELLRGETVTHHGTWARLDGVVLEPRPVQVPRPPMFLAASWPARRPLRRAAAWDGVMPQWDELWAEHEVDDVEGPREAVLRELVAAYREFAGEGCTVLVPTARAFGAVYERVVQELAIDWVLTMDDLTPDELRAGPPG